MANFGARCRRRQPSAPIGSVAFLLFMIEREGKAKDRPTNSSWLGGTQSHIPL